ncbi:MAG TPA: CehA/McbA family metallohydrolase [Bryobacteraceae bacterium]|nr:CehA/McbA family metallohydrolase [Bryobacteraceae bacterium]
MRSPNVITALILLGGMCIPGTAQMRRRVFSRILDQNHVGDLAYVPECYLPQITNGPNFPAWSPDGKQLAFAMKGSIWRLRLGETSAYELTTDASYDSQPAWSPDGRWIIYTAELDEQIHLKILDLETGSTRALTSGNSINVEPAWSPDGSRLVFVSTAPNGTFKIYLVSMNKGVAGKPVLLTPDFRLNPPSVYYGDMAHYINPTWTPDGKDLIFVSNRDNLNGTGGLYRMAAKPGASIKRFYYEETTWKMRPNVSPDGARLVYSSYLGRQWQQLWAMPPTGGDAFPLTYGDFDRTDPKWSPDGSRIAFVSNQTGDKTLWLFHWFGGKLEQVKVDKLVYKRPMGTLTVRVVDASTGKPMPARVHLDAADGRVYAPSGSWLRMDSFMEDHLETTTYQFFYTVGTFSVMLPVGKAQLAISRGLEYLPGHAEATISAGGTASVTIPLKRLDNLAAKGWWSGDNHFHMNYAGVYYTSTAELMRQAAAEDVRVLNNLICNKEQRIPDEGHFTGKIDPVSTSERVLFHNQEYHPPFWGHSVFLNLKEHLVIPDYVGYANTVVNSIYPPNTIPFRVAHEEGALAGYAHDTGANLPVDLALGTMDFLETNWPETMETLYHAWNCDYRIVASAGVDTFSDFYRSNLLGTNRVYVRSGPTLNYARWIADFRKGRSFVTTAPLIFLKVNGREPGDQIDLPAGSHTLTAEVDVESITPITSVDLIYNGKVIASVNPTGEGLKTHLQKAFTVTGSGWFAARTRARPIRNIRKPVPWAATMPVWVMNGKQPIRSASDAQFFIDWLDRTLAAAMGSEGTAKERAARDAAEKALGVPPASPPAWNNEWEKQQVRNLYAEARAKLVQRRDEGR